MQQELTVRPDLRLTTVTKLKILSVEGGELVRFQASII